MPEQPLRTRGPFARATRDALEAVVAAPVAATLLARAVEASGHGGVPEEVTSFRAFVEGPLGSELQRVLGPGAVAIVLERLGQVLWMATSDVRALSVARDWSRGSGGVTQPHESGSHPKVPKIPSDRPAELEQGAAKRPTMPAPASSPPGAVAPSDRPRVAPSSRPPLPASGSALSPRTPPPARPTLNTGIVPRVPRAAVTVAAMPRVAGAPMPTAVLVVTLDAALCAQATAELAGRCPLVTITAPVDLARAATRCGDRIVVIVDTTLPSIDLPTFVGLAPILPRDTRVVLWGADERDHARLASRFPTARAWVPSGDSSTPGTLAISLG